jgi:hypothetical protein
MRERLRRRIIAVGTHSDVSFVLAVQTLRLLVVIVTGPLVAKIEPARARRQVGGQEVDRQQEGQAPGPQAAEPDQPEAVLAPRAGLCGHRLDGGPALHPRHRAGDDPRPAGPNRARPGSSPGRRSGSRSAAGRSGPRPTGRRARLTAYLATSPGGLDSVAIIAVGTHSDVSFVLAVQTLRLLVVCRRR